MSQWTKEWMNQEHQIILLTCQENVLFNRFPVEIIMVFISTFTSWEVIFEVEGIQNHSAE